MSTSDWIALSSAAVALLAFGVGARALQLQQASAADDAQQEFDELTHKLGRALAESFAPMVPGQGGVGPAPNTAAAMTEVQSLALQADGLLEDSRAGPARGWRRSLRQIFKPSGPPLEADWNQAVLLASSFGQVWDVDRARHYWEDALKLCLDPETKVGPSGQITTLRSNATFRYLGNSDDDLAVARDAFDQAREILDPQANGADLTHAQNFWLWFGQAQQEDQLGNTAEAAGCVHKGLRTIEQVRAKWRRDQANDQMARFIAYGGDPDRFSGGQPLTAEIVARVADLRGQSQLTDAQRQALNVAWQQGYMAAQWQMSAQAHTGQAPAQPMPTVPSEDPLATFPPHA